MSFTKFDLQKNYGMFLCHSKNPVDCCGMVKLKSHFTTDPTKKNGIDSRCMTCNNRRLLQYQSPPNLSPDQTVFIRIEKKWHISPEESIAMLRKQNYVCRCCKNVRWKINPDGTSNLVVDHNHHTGRIRGFLCNACNTGYGLLKEDMKTLLNMVDYAREDILYEQERISSNKLLLHIEGS